MVNRELVNNYQNISFIDCFHHACALKTWVALNTSSCFLTLLQRLFSIWVMRKGKSLLAPNPSMALFHVGLDYLQLHLMHFRIIINIIFALEEETWKPFTTMIMITVIDPHRLVTTEEEERTFFRCTEKQYQFEICREHKPKIKKRETLSKRARHLIASWTLSLYQGTE